MLTYLKHQAKKSVAVEEKDVVLVINKKRQIFIENVRVPRKELTAKLKAIFKAKTKKEIFLQADQRISLRFCCESHGHSSKTQALKKWE